MTGGSWFAPHWRSAVARLSDYRDLLPEGTLNAWPAVAAALPEGGALMGGTGLAIWLRHRRSEDLDIFLPARFDVDAVLCGLSAAGEFLVTDASERLIRGVFNDVNVDIVVDDAAHRLGPTLEIDGLHVASLQDIAAGKFKAITGRKQLRDFIDVMFIETAGGLSIEQAVMLHFRRYGIDLSYSQVSGVLGHLVDFGPVKSDAAMEAIFGADIRDRVVEHFTARQLEVAAAFQQMLAEG